MLLNILTKLQGRITLGYSVRYVHGKDAKVAFTVVAEAIQLGYLCVNGSLYAVQIFDQGMSHLHCNLIK